MIKGKPYQDPPAVFRSGDKVEFEGEIYTVEAASHTHAQLKGRRFAVVNWRLTLVKRARRKKKNESNNPKAEKK